MENPKGSSVSRGMPRTEWNPAIVNGSSQQHSTCTYPDTNKSISHLSILLCLRSILLLSSYLCLLLPVLAELYQNTLFELFNLVSNLTLILILFRVHLRL